MANSRDIKNPWERSYEENKAKERMDREREHYDKKQSNREFQSIIGNLKEEEDEEPYDDEVWLG